MVEDGRASRSRPGQQDDRGPVVRRHVPARQPDPVGGGELHGLERQAPVCRRLAPQGGGGHIGGGDGDGQRQDDHGARQGQGRHDAPAQPAAARPAEIDEPEGERHQAGGQRHYAGRGGEGEARFGDPGDREAGPGCRPGDPDEEQGPAPPPASEAGNGGARRRGAQRDHDHPEGLPAGRAVPAGEERQGDGDPRQRRQTKQGGTAPLRHRAFRHVREEGNDLGGAGKAPVGLPRAAPPLPPGHRPGAPGRARRQVGQGVLHRQQTARRGLPPGEAAKDLDDELGRAPSRTAARSGRGSPGSTATMLWLAPPPSVCSMRPTTSAVHQVPGPHGAAGDDEAVHGVAVGGQGPRDEPVRIGEGRPDPLHLGHHEALLVVVVLEVRPGQVLDEHPDRRHGRTLTEPGRTTPPAAWGSRVARVSGARKGPRGPGRLPRVRASDLDSGRRLPALRLPGSAGGRSSSPSAGPCRGPARWTDPGFWVILVGLIVVIVMSILILHHADDGAAPGTAAPATTTQAAAWGGDAR